MLAVLAAGAGITYSLTNNIEPPRAQSSTDISQAPMMQPAAAARDPVATAPASVTAPDEIARWVDETQSSDAKTRAAAIAALADAPPATALRTLERVLESGEMQVDRQIAIHSLHVLALKDGDPNGAVRDVLRHALYHGDDEGVTQSAQAVLEDIEAELAARAASR